MKYLHLPVILAAVSFGLVLVPSAAAAAGSPSPSPSASTGQALYANLQNGTVSCSQLTDNNFDSLGDFFTERMMGSAADSMNQAMERRLGSDGERAMHIVMGKRLSGCDPNAEYPNNNYAPVAWMMGGSMMGYGYNMMNGWGGYGGWDWLGMGLFWLLVIGVIVLIVWLVAKNASGSGKRSESSALDILKERYAKGEINKDEYDQRRKDLKA